jgi:hypothetical protein
MVDAPGPPALAPPEGPLSGARHRRFLVLMVGAPRPSALAPPGGLPSMFLSVDGGRFRITSSDTSRGPAIDVLLR